MQKWSYYNLINRKATQSEEKLLEFLINKASTKVPNDWKEKLIVSPINDGNMGGLYLSLSTEMDTKRLFGKQVSECHFVDSDGIDVIVSLNIDKNGNLFELDIWKTDYSSLKKFQNNLIWIHCKFFCYKQK